MLSPSTSPIWTTRLPGQAPLTCASGPLLTALANDTQPKGTANTAFWRKVSAPRLAASDRMENSTPVTPKPKSAPSVSPLKVLLNWKLDIRSMSNGTASVWVPSGNRVMSTLNVPVTSAQAATAAPPTSASVTAATQNTLISHLLGKTPDEPS